MIKKYPFVKLLLKTVAVVFVGTATFISSLFLLFLVLVVAIITAGFVLGSSDIQNRAEADNKHVFGKKESENKLLSIPVSGVILGDKREVDPFSFLDPNITFGYEIKRQLYDAAEDPEIKGVILEVNSPGGTIYGSRAIADGVAYYKDKTKKPVITHVSGIGASGSYWASVSADHVIADFGSEIGSVGVIMGPFKFYDNVTSEDAGAFIGGVVTQDGIETTYITAGKSKDLGNPYRRLTGDEVQSLQQSINNEYNEFVAYVSKRRNITEDKIRNQIGALVFDVKTSKELGLIDEVKNKEDAYQELAKRSKVEDNYQVVSTSQKAGYLAFLSGIIGTPVKREVESCKYSSSILAYYGDIAEICQN